MASLSGIRSDKIWPESPMLVAEIGGNHGGSMELAEEMILAAKFCGVDYVKFQKRDVEAKREQWSAIQRTDSHSFGATEYEHRKALEFSIEQHQHLKNFAESHGLGYSCSAWDEKSFVELVNMKCDYIKIPSAKNIEWMKWDSNPDPQGYKVHISLGMTTQSERDKIFSELKNRGLDGRAVVYACTSKYPAEMSDLYLYEISDIKAHGFIPGFSGHHKGIAIDLGAMMLGAKWIERHFTLDRTSKGTDHAASLEPDGLRKLSRDLKAVYAALKSKPEFLPECEKAMYKKFKGTV